MTSNRILELANFIFHEANNLTKHQATEFYHLAHADGQRAMRERAAKECDFMGAASSCAEEIRNLETEQHNDDVPLFLHPQLTQQEQPRSVLEFVFCKSCGSHMTDEELIEAKKTKPKLISCCPDREMYGAVSLTQQEQPRSVPEERFFPFEFEVWDDNGVVASASGQRDDALREAIRYAAQYEEDGPVRIFEVTRTLAAAPKEPEWGSREYVSELLKEELK